MPATEPNTRQLGASLCPRASLLMNTEYPQKAIGFARAITPFIPREDRAADQAHGLRRHVLRQ
eukprot:2536909-Alexandrium_andersonii.AAC.1